MPVESRSSSIFAGTNGFLDDVAVEQRPGVRDEFARVRRRARTDLLEAILQTRRRRLTDDEATRRTLDEFKATSTPSSRQSRVDRVARHADSARSSSRASSRHRTRARSRAHGAWSPPQDAERAGRDRRRASVRLSRSAEVAAATSSRVGRRRESSAARGRRSAKSGVRHRHRRPIAASPAPSTPTSSCMTERTHRRARGRRRIGELSLIGQARRRDYFRVQRLGAEHVHRRRLRAPAYADARSIAKHVMQRITRRR